MDTLIALIILEIIVLFLTFILGFLVGSAYWLTKINQMRTSDNEKLRNALKMKKERTMNAYCQECDALTTPAKPGEPLHPCSGFTDEGEPILACESYLSEHLPVLSNEALTAELSEARARIAILKNWLRQIAIVNCTCDEIASEATINPAKHSKLCMYRIMIDYRPTPDQQDLDDLDTLPTMGEMAATYRGKIK